MEREQGQPLLVIVIEYEEKINGSYKKDEDQFLVFFIF